MGKARGRRAKKEEEKYIHVEKEGKVRDQSSPAPKQEANEEHVPGTFLGLVDTSELEYFKQAELTLNANAFESDEDRAGFVSSVLEESKGKELKLVTNQICSKLMERLILNASDEQLKQIFKSLNGHFVSLIHNKYASHCVETLLVRTAALIEKELLNPFPSEEIDDEYVSMENLFLFFLNEIRPHLYKMLTHTYASHTLRLIILIISAKELPSSTMSNSTLRSKKSKIARKMIEIGDNQDFNKSFQVPSSFKEELKQLLDSILAKLDFTTARNYAIDPIASPVIQLLIQAEGIVNKDRPFWHLCFCKETEDEEPIERGFVQMILTQNVGSHFFQNVIKDQRLKYVERLYRLYISHRVLKLANHDTTATYIIQALLKKLKQNEVREMLDQLIPEMCELMNKNLEMGQAIIDASSLHHDYKRDQIIEELAKKYTPSANESDILESVLQLSSSTLGNTRDDWPTAEERRRSLFLEKLISFDERFLNLTVENLLSLPKERLIQMCFHGVFSHVVENVLVPELDIIKRRRMLNQFMGSIADLCCNAYGSHIVDKLWLFTLKLNNYKERIANEMVAAKEKVKESTYGRQVWKNWKMELFTRKRHDWTFAIKEEEYAKFPPKKPEPKDDESKTTSGFDKKRKQFNDSHNDKANGQKKQKVRGRNRN